MKKYIKASAFIMSVGMIFSGCASAQESTDASVQDTAAETTVAEAAETEETAETTAENAVAGADETVANELIIPDDMIPVYASSLKDGTYEIKVDSSSSMFNIEHCELTVADGKMTAVMTMGGKGYLYVFMGKGEDAAEDGYIPFAENEDGAHTFTVPVEALDMGIDCSAFSKKKEKWYDRTLLFRADSLPLDAFADGVITTPESLGLADGEYSVNVTLEGGSGRASVSSPARLIAENGGVKAEIIWSSSNYDYMVVNEERYDCINTEGNSTFIIPVTCFDAKMAVKADTTAMSTPHEIEYTLFFDSSSIE